MLLSSRRPYEHALGPQQRIAVAIGLTMINNPDQTERFCWTESVHKTRFVALKLVLSLWVPFCVEVAICHLIKARTDDGRKRAKGRGVRFGRPRKLDQHQRQEALRRLANGETLVDVARTYGVDPTTIGRLQSPAGKRGRIRRKR